LQVAAATVVAVPPAVVAAVLALVVVDEVSLLSPHAAATSAIASNDATIQRAFLKVPPLIKSL
jgi:hypothetical protein